MPGAGDLSADEFSAVLDGRNRVSVVRAAIEPITDTKYAIGLHAAHLVRDGGRCRSASDRLATLAQGLIVRHRDNTRFHEIMKRLAPRRAGCRRARPARSKSLYGVSEMLFRGVFALIEPAFSSANRRRVAARRVLSWAEIVLSRAARDDAGATGAHPDDAGIASNQLYGDEDSKRRARTDARFVNNAMMATLMGAAISDGLENGQVVSGVGGQYNFVAQAFALRGARSILAVRRPGRPAPNAIEHPLDLRPPDHSTASARYLRHEYGVADVRGNPTPM
jgi:hypothetical protein